MRACVVGAGVVGLLTAMELQRELGASLDLTILADKFNEETTGDGAAGFFYPSTYFAGPTFDVTKQWIRDSFEWYSAVCWSDQARAAGVAEVTGYFFSNQSRDRVRNPVMEELCPEYRDATEDELQLIPGGARFGTYASTLIVECRYFLPWALHRIQAAGGRVQRRAVSRLDNLSEDFDAVFNCTGLGAAKLCGDHTLVPVRGQVYKVTAPWIKTFTYFDRDTYIIPNRHQVTLGGSRWLGNYSLEVDAHESAAIWERCVSVVPSLQAARVQRQWVGLRPFRCPVRVEADKALGSDTFTVVHNYGHGGYGITSAPGTARHAVKAFREQHRAGVGSCKL
ncbi:D-aspartate oxidase [Frankliniella fusca]|uniref:D-aspartate oxidase n=1 Tax=Frankliniella fusca TaxID=407009 RepID=A0AAE1LPG6_9NEOP|nr:D-aspartate oxidase [Frankliniella fusca]